MPRILSLPLLAVLVVALACALTAGLLAPAAAPAAKTAATSSKKCKRGYERKRVSVKGKRVVRCVKKRQVKRPSGPSRLMVRGYEWGITLSRQSIFSGSAIVQFLNGGEDDHDLRIRRLNRRGKPYGPTTSFTELRPGKLETKKTSFRQGRYQLYCSLSGHKKLGMKATLKVR